MVRFLAGSQVFLTVNPPDHLCYRPTYPRHIQRVPEAFSLEAKRPQREADHSQSSAGARNEWSHTSKVVCFNGVNRDSFTMIITCWRNTERGTEVGTYSIGIPINSCQTQPCFPKNPTTANVSTAVRLSAGCIQCIPIHGLNLYLTQFLAHVVVIGLFVTKSSV